MKRMHSSIGRVIAKITAPSRGRWALAAAVAALAPALGASASTIMYVSQTGGPVLQYPSATTGSSGSSSTFTSAIADPFGITTDSNGNVFVVDNSARTVTAFNSSATSMGTSGTTTGTNAYGVTIYNGNQVYVANSSSVNQFNVSIISNVATFTAASPDRYKNDFGSTTLAGLATGANGAQPLLYVAGQGLNKVYAFDLSTSSASPAFNVALSAAEGIAVDSSDNVYVSSFTTSGTITKYSSTLTGGTVIATGLNDPGLMAIGPDGDLYVAEYGAGKIDQFNLTTFAKTTYVSGLTHPIDVAFSTTATPEPATMSVVGAAALMLLGRRPRKAAAL